MEPVKPATTSNAGIHLASEREGATPAGTEGAVRLRVSSASDSKREQLKVGWKQPGQKAFAGSTLDVYVPPGQSRVLTLAKETSAAADLDGVMLSGDDEEFDNVLHVLPPKTQEVTLLYLGTERETDTAQPLYYLKRAFQQTPTLAVQILSQDSATALAEDNRAAAHLTIVTRALKEEESGAVQKSLAEGKGVLVVLSDPKMAGTVGQLVGQQELSAEEATGANYAMLAQIDFDHPLFAPFADPRYSDFTKIHFWKHRRAALDKIPGSKAIAQFDDGSPALAEVSVGKGKLWILTSSWAPEDSQLALSSKFVPLLYAMLEQSGGLRSQMGQHLIGDAVPLPAGNQPVTIRKPDGSQVQLNPGERFTGTDQAGVYTMTSVQPPRQFAVNLAPEESRTAPLHLEDLERLGVPVQHQIRNTNKQTQQRREHLQAAQLENRQKLWRWLIVGALVVLMVETWLAGRVTRQPTAAG
jgi:hypothetical protein